MSNDINRREKLIGYIEQINRIIENGNNGDKVKESIKKLSNDINDDFYIIVVLGEFKRGKSTLVNALLQKDILLSDVLPETAVIQAIMNDSEPKAQIVYKDGSHKDGFPDKDFLSRVSAKGNDTEVVDYVKIAVPVDFLGDKIVLVDTPGVADLNEQRLKVTYDFIPKANVVLFVLDATSPMKRTEKEFIEECLIKQGINKVVFVINKMDSFDNEEEDYYQYMSTVRSRIESVLKGEDKIKTIDIIPVSALQALRGYESGNDSLIQQSNIDELKKKISEIITGGDIEKQKLDRFQERLKNILLEWKRECENTIALYNVEEKRLAESLQRIQDEKQEQNERYEIIKEYVYSEKEAIFAMVNKSLYQLSKNLLVDVDYEIDRYKGTNFKEFIERDLPHFIRKYIESWVNNRYYRVDTALAQLENKLSEALSRCFNKNVFVHGESADVDLNQHNPSFEMTADDVSSAQVQAGLVTAGGVIGLYLTGMAMFAPVLSMVAFPYLREKLMNTRLDEAKKKAIPYIHEQLEKLMIDLKTAIEDNLSYRIDTIANSVQHNYTSLLSIYERNMKKVLVDKQNNNGAEKKEEASKESHKIEMVINSINNL